MLRDDVIPMKVNHVARASLVKAMDYDQKSREESLKRATDYLNRHELKDKTMPEWMWIVLWITLGILSVISIDIIVQNWATFDVGAIKKFF